jgi:hypothetical protein
MADKIFGVCVTVRTKPGIVTMKMDKCYCVTCKKNYCCHAEYVNELRNCIENVPDAVVRMITSCSSETADVRKKTANYSVFFKKRVPFQTTECESSILRKLTNVHLISLLSPNTTECECGCQHFCDVVVYDQSVIITMTSICKVRGW